jgi:hypothetical protein
MKSREQIKNEAEAMLALKRRELGADSSDRAYYQHHLKKLEKIENNKEAIGIENYDYGNEVLPKLTPNIVKQLTKNSSLINVNSTKFNLSDLAKMHTSGINQNKVNEINNRYQLKDQPDMEDLMSLSSRELNAFKELVIKHRQKTIPNTDEYRVLRTFLPILNKVIEKHNLEHAALNAIEPIEILIDLNKIQNRSVPSKESSEIRKTLEKNTNMLPLIRIKEEEYRSMEVSPTSSRSTIIHSYSRESFNTDTTEAIYQSEEIAYRNTSFNPTITPNPPSGRKPSTRFRNH